MICFLEIYLPSYLFIKEMHVSIFLIFVYLYLIILSRQEAYKSHGSQWIRRCCTDQFIIIMMVMGCIIPCSIHSSSSPPSTPFISISTRLFWLNQWPRNPKNGMKLRNSNLFDICCEYQISGLPYVLCISIVLVEWHIISFQCIISKQ